MKARGITKETIMELGMAHRSFPEFKIGDTIDIGIFVKEGDKERLQSFVGDVIAFHNNGVSSTFTVRRIAANGIGMERVLPLYSPIISTIKIVKRGEIRRAKLFYVRDRVGKAARISERILTKEQKEVLAQSDEAAAAGE